MKSHRLYEIHAEICQALTHPIRLEIIDLLRDGEKGVSELVQELAEAAWDLEAGDSLSMPGASEQTDHIFERAP